MKIRQWLEICEYLSLAGTVAGSVAAVMSKQILYAVAPVSVSLALNLTNRRLFEVHTRASTGAALEQLNQQLSSLDSAKQEWSEALKNIIHHLEGQAKSSNTQPNLSDIRSQIEQLKWQESTLERCVNSLQQQLEEFRDNFKHRPELQQIESLTEVIATLKHYLDRLHSAKESQAPVEELQQRIENAIAQIPARVEAAGHNFIEEINQQLQAIQKPYEYELVMKRERSQVLLTEAVSKAQNRLIVVCPWLRQGNIDKILLGKFRALLNRNSSIHIGWASNDQILSVADSPLMQLQLLAKQYPERVLFKRLETHENFLVCDCSFAWVGSLNVVNEPSNSDQLQVGVRTTDPRIIQELIQRFDQAEALKLPPSNLAASAINEFADEEELQK